LLFIASSGRWLGAQESGRAKILSPLRDSRVTPEEVFIAVQVVDPAKISEVGRWIISVDRVDVTSEAKFRGGVLSYVPRQPLSPGRHLVAVVMTEKEGGDFFSEAWNFSVERVTAAPRARETAPGAAGPSFRLNGQTVLDANYNDQSGSGAYLRQEPSHTNTVTLGGSFHYGAFEVPVRLFLTSDEAHDKQPKNRIEVAVKTRWGAVSFGDNNPYYSSLVLRGARVRGVGGYAQVGPLRLDLVVGNTRRGIEGFPGSRLQTRRPGTFQRKLWAGKLSLGDNENFRLGFTALRAKDDTSSIRFGTKPKENLAGGVDLLMAFARRRIVLEATVAASALTQDASLGVLSKETADSVYGKELPFDPEQYKDILTINSSTLPAGPGTSSVAYEVGMRIRMLGQSLDAHFRSIGPAYASLGNPSLQNDRRGFRVNDRFELLRRRMSVALGFEHFRDNLDGSQPTTRKTNTLTSSISYVPRRDLPTTTLSFSRYARDSGELLGQDVLTTVGLSVQHSLQVLGNRSGVGVSYFRTRRTNDTRPLDEVNVDNVWVNVRTEIGERYSLQAGYGFNRTRFPHQGLWTDQNSPSLRVARRFLANRLETSVGWRLVASSGKVATFDSKRHFYDLGVSYRFLRDLWMQAGFGFIRFRDENDSSNNFSEKVFRVTLNQSFALP